MELIVPHCHTTHHGELPRTFAIPFANTDFQPLSESEFKSKYHAATLRGAAEGILGAIAVAVPASFILNRRSANYRALPIQLKAFGVILVIGKSFEFLGGVESHFSVV